MDMRYFNYCGGLTMTSGRFHELFGCPPSASRSRRSPSERWTWPHLCRPSLKRSCCAWPRHIHELCGLRNLVMAGGVAPELRGQRACVARRAIRKPLGPARGWRLLAGRWAQLNLSGISYSRSRARFLAVTCSTAPFSALLFPSLKWQRSSPTLRPRPPVIRMTTAFVAQSQNCSPARTWWVGFRGAWNLGPRALGARSILGDAREYQHAGRDEPEN